MRSYFFCPHPGAGKVPEALTHFFLKILHILHMPTQTRSKKGADALFGILHILHILHIPTQKQPEAV